MKVNLIYMLDSYGVTLEKIAECIGVSINNNQNAPRTSVSFDKLHAAVGEYMAESLEAGESPNYTLSQLFSESENQDILRKLCLKKTI